MIFLKNSHMKNIFLFILLFLGSSMTCTAQTEKLDQFFNSFENKSGVTSIDIKKPMFDLMNKIEINDEYVKKIKPIMRDVDGLKLLVFSKITFPDHLKSENVGQIKMNEAKSKRVENLLSNLNLNELMSLKSDDFSMKFLAENAKDGILENLIFNVDSKDEIVIFMLNGKMKMDDVNKIINSDETSTSSSSTTTVKNSFNSDNDSSYLNGETRNVGEFSGLEVSTGVDVVFKQENATNVKVFADSDKLQYIITKVENGILKVYIDNKGAKKMKFKNLSVNISSPRMENIKTSSGASFSTINNINGSNINIDASSGSSVKGKFNISKTSFIEASSGSNVKVDINTVSISVKSSSGSNVNVEGNSDEGMIDVSSGAVVKADNLRINNAEVESTSGSSASVNVKDKMRVKASSGGSVRYKGNPKIDSDVSKMSGGSLSSIN